MFAAAQLSSQQQAMYVDFSSTYYIFTPFATLIFSNFITPPVLGTNNHPRPGHWHWLSSYLKVNGNSIERMSVSCAENQNRFFYFNDVLVFRFEKLDITPKSAQKIKPVLERWMKEAEERWGFQNPIILKIIFIFNNCCSLLNSRYKSGQNHLTDFIGIEPSKKRKRRTSFTPQALELLNAHFERNTHPSGMYDR